MANRIKELRDDQNLSQEDLGKMIGTTGVQIGRLEREERDLSVKWLTRIAKGLKVPLDELLILEHRPVRVKISGIVQAGLWAEPDEEYDYGLTPDDYVDIPVPDSHKSLKLYAVQVRGSSMNLLYPEGTTLICVHLDETGEAPVSGRKYIVQRTRRDGAIETTVKEFSIDQQGRKWAWPRSSDPEWQQPYPLDQGLDGETIELKARVLWSMKPE